LDIRESPVRQDGAAEVAILSAALKKSGQNKPLSGFYEISS
jgi:hypothetical protein